MTGCRSKGCFTLLVEPAFRHDNLFAETSLTSTSYRLYDFHRGISEHRENHPTDFLLDRFP
jgi:hypothetical protein